MGYRKRALWDCRRGTMAHLGEELKAGKGRDLNSLGQKQALEKGIKGAWFCVNRFLVSTLAWPCHALDQCCLSCMLIKPYF